MAEIIPRYIEREDVQELILKGARLVEVLTGDQYKRIHIAGAESNPLTQISADTTRHWMKDQAVIVYCYDFQ